MSAYRPVLAENGLHDIQNGHKYVSTHFMFKNYQLVGNFWKAIHMKASPNNSTSKAKNHVCGARCRARSATELRFGLVQVQTHVRTPLAPILSFSIFHGPSRSLSVGISTL